MEKEIDSTENEIPKDVTREELLEDQHRKISEKDKKDAEKIIKESGLDKNAEEH